MSEYTYGPKIAHNGDKCPVATDEEVRVWIAGNKSFSFVHPAIAFRWDSTCYPILVYQIATPIPEPVAGERVFYGIVDHMPIFMEMASPGDWNVKLILPTVNDKLVSCKCGMCRVEDL